ncbi:MAG: geranylgeranyl reductase family protein [Anaerolineae bacterium]|nr:geranylgeranyl reductase family protein [Anaerolineae bacterium]
MKTEVAIVGAGPAGSIAAHRLAAAGARVALLERATFPRDKACGDGVSAHGLAALERTGLGEWASQFTAPEVLRLTSPDGQVLDVQPEPVNGHCYGRTIPRRLLDARLAQAAAEAGAHLLEGTRVRSVERANGCPLRIAAEGVTVEAQMVILADGSNAPVTRRMGLVQGPPELIAIRQYLAGDTGPDKRMEIHFEPWITPGYTWLFPMGAGHVNVGTGTFTRRVHQDGVALKDILARFTSDPAAMGERLAQAEPAGPVRGHPLHTRMEDTRTHAERVLVVGDAAGLVSPLSGEGIARAMESGEMAAAHALMALAAGDFSARALAAYTRDLRARYAAEQRAARFLQRALHAPRLLNRIFRKLRRDEDLAMLIGFIILSHRSPRLALRPATLVRLLT